MDTAKTTSRSATGTVIYYVILIAGLAIFIGSPFLALQQPWTLAITVPLVLIWGVWVLSSYWRWVRTLGK
jgi:hypothetical protein